MDRRLRGEPEGGHEGGKFGHVKVLPSFQGKIKTRRDDPDSRHDGDIEQRRRLVVEKRDGLETRDEFSAPARTQGANRGLDERHEKPSDGQVDDKASEVEIELRHTHSFGYKN